MKGSKRWIVRVEDGATVGHVLPQFAAHDPDALTEGRVFLGKKRVVSPAQRVRCGEELIVYQALAEFASPLEILAHENGVVAVNKPAEIPTVADHRGRAHSLHGQLARHLNLSHEQLHPTSRLDVGVSGVVLFALDEAARDRLQRARQAGTYQRSYAAIVEGVALPAHAQWTVPVGRGPDPRRRYAAGRDALPATTNVVLVATASGASLLQVEPATGRTHQIRLHAAHAGSAVLGDSVYGKKKRMTTATGAIVPWSRIALHAAAVTIPDRTGGAQRFVAPIPLALRELWRLLDGAEEAWQVFERE